MQAARSKSKSFVSMTYLVPPGERKPTWDYSMCDAKGRKYTTYFPRPGLPQVNVRIRARADLILSKQSIGKRRFTLNEVKGRLVVESGAGEATASEWLCYKSLSDASDLCKRYSEGLLFEKNESFYSKGVLFKDKDEIRKWFPPLGDGRVFNSYSGSVGRLFRSGKQVCFEVSEEGCTDFSCPTGVFRVSGCF